MAVFSATGNAPANQSGVAISTKADGFTIKWDPQPANSKVQVMWSTTNNRNTALESRVVVDTYFDSPKLAIGTYYAWTRRVSAYGIPGAWDLGATSGRSIVVDGITVDSIDATKVNITSGSTASSISMSVASAANMPTSYDVWTDTGSYLNFVAPSGGGMVTGYIGMGVFGTNGVASTGFAQGKIVSRLRLVNYTDSIELPAYDKYWIHSTATSSAISPYGVTFDNLGQRTTHTIGFTYGFGANGLTPGKTYRYKVQIIKTRSTTALTFDVSSNGFDLQGGSSEHVTY